MKIIIAGAGDVGFHLAKLMSVESQDIILIDANEDVLNYANSKLDVLAIRGDATSMKILEEAGISDTDLLISATSSENTNLLISIIGKKLGAKRTIARVEKDQYLDKEVLSYFNSLGVDFPISTKHIASNEIVKLITKSALINIHEFEDGQLNLIGINLDKDSEIVGKSVIEIAHLNTNIVFRPIAIKRELETIIPRGNTRFELNDNVYFITKKSGIDNVLKLAGKEDIKIKKVMILGGSSIAQSTANLLQKDYDVIIIEKDKSRCLKLAETLSNVLIIHGDGSNLDILEEEGIDKVDAFLSLTGNTETNIISCLVAKQHGVKKTISLVEKVELTNLSQQVGVDTLINRKYIAADYIFKFVRKGKVRDVASLQGINAEVIEYEVNKGSKITQDFIKEIGFPENALIGGVIRKNKCFIPLGDFKVEVGDKVVVFTVPETLPEVEKFFR